MLETLTRIAAVPLIFAPLVAVYLAHRWVMRWAGEPRPKPPREASSDAEWIALPFQLVAGLAGLLWCLIGLTLCAVVFFAPLAFVVALVLGALQ